MKKEFGGTRVMLHVMTVPPRRRTPTNRRAKLARLARCKFEFSSLIR